MPVWSWLSRTGHRLIPYGLLGHRLRLRLVRTRARSSYTTVRTVPLRIFCFVFCSLFVLIREKMKDKTYRTYSFSYGILFLVPLSFFGIKQCIESNVVLLRVDYRAVPYLTS